MIGDETVLWNKVMGEVKAKRYAGPYKQIPFKNYIQSPIGLVPKDGGTKTRLIFHLSHPRLSKRNQRKLSVNAITPPELIKVKYPDFNEGVRLCLETGLDCAAAKSDMSSAFRHLPIAKKFWKYLIMKAKHPKTALVYYFIDKCLPFGAAISCALFQLFSNAVAHIVSYRTNKKLVNYLDDFFFVALFKLLCNWQVREFLQVCSTINFPVSLEKTVWASTCITFLGLLINTKTATVSIPLEKIEKTILAIKNFLRIGRKKVKVIEVQRLTGLLNFVAVAVVLGRAFTRRLYSLLRGNKTILKPNHHICLTKEIRSDLNVWLQFLDHPSAFARQFMDFSTVLTATDIDFFTDATRNPYLGCGGHCEKEWFFMQWDSQFIIDHEPSIEFLELYAVVIGIFLWIHKFKNKRIFLFCDNMSVVYMINKCTSFSK